MLSFYRPFVVSSRKILTCICATRFGSSISNCPGCGSHFQTEKPTKPGYVRESTWKSRLQSAKDPKLQLSYLESLPILTERELKLLLKARKNKSLICQRCHDATYKHVLSAAAFPDMTKLFSHVKVNPHGIVVHVFDATDFPASAIPALPAMVGNKKIIAVANKWDLMPKPVNEKKAKQFYIDHLKGHLQWDRVDDLHLVSARNGDKLFELVDAINKRQTEDDVFLFGRANVGKSQLINAIFKAAAVDSHPPPTICNIPGTTTDLLNIPLSLFGDMFKPKQGDYHVSSEKESWNTSQLIDTPGIKNDDQIMYLLEPKELQMVMPKRELTFVGCKSFLPGSAFYVGGLVRIEYVSGKEPVQIAFAGSRGITLDFSKKNRTVSSMKLSPPLVKEREISFPELEMVQEFKYVSKKESKGKDSYDIAVGGLGWISINCTFPTESTFRIYTPAKTPVVIRKSLYTLEPSMIKAIA